MKVVNRSLGNLLRCLTEHHGQSWDHIIRQVEFSYYNSINRSTIEITFEIMYGTHPRGILELRDLSLLDKKSAQVESFVEQMKELHDQVNKTLQKQVENYKSKSN